jgi:phosphoglycolate phosphatase
MTQCKTGMAGTRLVLIDLDGTLIDSIGDIHAAVNHMLAEQSQDPLALPDVRRMVGDGAAVLIERVMAARPALGLDASAALQRYLELYEAEPLGLTQLYPGVAETLDRLRARGYRLAVCTNKPERPSRAILESFGLADRFERIVGGDSLPWRKPDRRMLDSIMADLGESIATTVLVGDSEVDAAAAAAAGMPFVLMSYGYRRGPVETIECRAALDDFADLAALFA